MTGGDMRSRNSIDKKITQVSFGRTINIGNYESVRIDLVAEVGQDKWEDTLQDLEREMLVLEKKIKKTGCLC